MIATEPAIGLPSIKPGETAQQVLGTPQQDIAAAESFVTSTIPRYLAIGVLAIVALIVLLEMFKGGTTVKVEETNGS